MIVGSFFAIFHLGWLILVAIGSAKPLIDFVLMLHHISFSYAIASFSLIPAIGLLIFTFVAGYIFGWIFAAVWNALKK